MANGNSIALEFTQVFAAQRERVFAAFINPAAIRDWWAPKGWYTPHAEMDVRVGGKYRFGMRSNENPALMFVHGEYLVVQPPERLVFTYIWEQGDAGDKWKEFGLIGVVTTVTIEFRERDGKTEVLIRHEGFPTEDGCDQHRHGWASNWASLEDYVVHGIVKQQKKRN